MSGPDAFADVWRPGSIRTDNGEQPAVGTTVTSDNAS